MPKPSTWPLSGDDAQAERLGALLRHRVEPLGELLVDHRAHRGDRDRRLLGVRHDAGVFGLPLDLEHPVEQRAELQAVEDLAHRGRVDRLAGEVAGADRQVDIGEQAVEPAVPDDAVVLVAQVVAHDARDLVGVLEQLVDGAVLLDPLDGGLLADLVDARCRLSLVSPTSAAISGYCSGSMP